MLGYKEIKPITMSEINDTYYKLKNGKKPHEDIDRLVIIFDIIFIVFCFCLEESEMKPILERIRNYPIDKEIYDLVFE